MRVLFLIARIPERSKRRTGPPAGVEALKRENMGGSLGALRLQVTGEDAGMSGASQRSESTNFECSPVAAGHGSKSSHRVIAASFWLFGGKKNRK
ncbi:hypothetical protein EYF80_026875 [Liparis tanakae]|uniref:Uncharacterized protein n=1 Tax=Liparis tanakae TaxID=230148 RepID=A0A4Z2HD25_9TELE|nr:hypothetical protein EYF80_026875 [Liparis tanakae]